MVSKITIPLSLVNVLKKNEIENVSLVSMKQGISSLCVCGGLWKKGDEYMMSCSRAHENYIHVVHNVTRD